MYRHTVVARLKNGSPELPLDPTISLPAALTQCEQLWKERGGRTSWPREQWSFVRKVIEPLLYATIDPEDVHYAGGLLNARGTIRSQSVELSSVSFKNGPLPTISCYAQFEMTFDREFDDVAGFYDWQEQTDWLDWGTNFGWRLEDGSEYDAAYDNVGIELEIIQ
ncbi:hypothetical protein [Methylobacterium sp. CM6257]